MPFFTRLVPNPADIVRVHELFIESIAKFDALAAAGVSTAPRQARLMISAYADFRTEVELVAVRTAELANKLIPGLFTHSRVRPPTGGSGPHLEEALPTSVPVATPLPAGVVGIVSLEALDKFSYWKAQEFGSDHMVGREIKGWFFGTGFGSVAAPDPTQFRQHPLFRPTTGAGRVAHFQNPIPEGKFIREGLKSVESYWVKGMLGVSHDAMKDINAVIGLGRRAVPTHGLTRGARTKEYARLRKIENPRRLSSALREL